MPHTKAKPVVNTRIQARNKELILEAALDVFSASGFRGATVDQIAAKSEMSKPNLLYYFRRKEDIYVALLEHTLSDWLEPLRELNPDGRSADRTCALYLRQDADVGGKSQGLTALCQ